MTTALITGASSGIGRAFATELAATGHDLVLVARDRSRLEELAAQLHATYRVNCEVLVADLSDRDQLEQVAVRLRGEQEDAVDLLVNNAGFGLPKAFLDSAVEDQEDQLAVLCRAVLVLSHAAGVAMRGRGRGHIINVSSIASFVTMGTYSAAKAWVTVFTQSLAADLAGTGVGATALCPGYTRTEFHERMGEPVGSIPAALWLDADRLVRAGLADARAGRVISTPGVVYRAIEVITGVTPRGLLGRVSAAFAGTRQVRRDRVFHGPGAGTTSR